jgi:hypothetical protein
MAQDDLFIALLIVIMTVGTVLGLAFVAYFVVHWLSFGAI